MVQVLAAVEEKLQRAIQQLEATQNFSRGHYYGSPEGANQKQQDEKDEWVLRQLSMKVQQLLRKNYTEGEWDAANSKNAERRQEKQRSLEELQHELSERRRSPRPEDDVEDEAAWKYPRKRKRLQPEDFRARQATTSAPRTGASSASARQKQDANEKRARESDEELGRLMTGLPAPTSPSVLDF